MKLEFDKKLSYLVQSSLYINFFIFQTLAEWGITSALVPYAKNDSKNIQELVARVLNAVCKFAELRGFVVQQGGSKALCGMSLECTEKGQRQASQALARIGITQDPTIAFPGQRVSISQCTMLQKLSKCEVKA